MPFITAEEMAAVITSRMGSGNATLNPSHWNTVAADVVISAYNAIVEAMADRGIIAELESRGLTLSNWDRAEEFNKRVGWCHFLRELAPAEAYDGSAIDRICRCEEDLKTLTVTVDGEVITPTSDNGRVSYGEYDTADDIHTMDDEL